MKKNKKGVSIGKIVAVGAGAIAAGAGAYYFLGKDGKKHQKEVKAWVNKKKVEVENKLKKIKSV